MIAQLIKFCVVGASGMIVDFGITYLLKEVAKINKYIANSLGFLCAATSNYVLNRIWTFGSTDPHIARQYFVFILISAIGLAINNLVIWILNDKMKLDFNAIIRLNRPDGQKVNFYISKLFAIAAVTLWNFFMNYFFNFNA